VRLGTFLDDMPQTGPFLVKSGQSEEVIHFTGSISNLEESTLDLYSLAYGKGDRHMEPFIVDLHPKMLINTSYHLMKVKNLFTSWAAR